MGILPKTLVSGSFKKRLSLERQIIRYESDLNKDIFGPIPKGHKRDFFCIDKNTWIWHEQFKDRNNQKHTVMTKYLVRKSGGIIKSQNGSAYKLVEKKEALNLLNAIILYSKRVQGEYVKLLQSGSI